MYIKLLVRYMYNTLFIAFHRGKIKKWLDGFMSKCQKNHLVIKPYDH